MNDFVIVDSGLPRFADELVGLAPSFGASEEFRRLNDSDLELMSLVFGAFRRFVDRVH